MSLTVGRVTGLRPEPGWTRSGDTVTFSGTFATSSSATAAVEIDVKRMQIQNLVDNPDEEYYRVLYTADPSLDGYYRVVDSSVSALGTIRGGAGRWTITLERVPDSANPRQEVAYMVGPRANGHTPAAYDAVLSAIGADQTDDFDIPQIELNRWLAGNVSGFLFPLATSSAVVGSLRYSPTPTSHYDGTCLLEEKIGANWYPVISRQATRPLTQWRVSNGLIRVSGDTMGQLTVEGWSAEPLPGGGTWESAVVKSSGDLTTSARSDNLLKAASVASSSLPHMTILRNDLDCIVLRYDRRRGASSTFTLTRGAWHIEWSSTYGLASASLTDGYHGIGFATDTTTTSVTPSTMGIQGPLTARSGRFVFMSLAASTADNTRGKIRLDSPSANPMFGIGYLPNGLFFSTMRGPFFMPTWAKTRLVVR